MKKSFLFLIFSFSFFYETFLNAREYYISYSFSYRRMHSSDVDMFLEDRDFTASGIRLGGEIIKNLIFELEYMRMNKSKWISVFSDYSANFDSHWITGSLRYGYEFFKFIEPFAKAGFGFTIGKYQFSFDTDIFSDFSFPPHFYFAGGIEFFIPPKFFGAGSNSFFRDFTAGIAFELGYIYEFAMNLNEMKAKRGKKILEELEPLKTANLKFGHASLSGLFFKTMLIIHF